MTIRHMLSRLGDPAARRTFGRTWLGVCLAAAACHTLLNLLLFSNPYVFFVLVVWLVGVFAPVRIAVELLHFFGPRMREQVQRDVQRREDRYATRERLAIMVELVFEREVRMPPLAPPELSLKVPAAATQLSDRALRGGGGSPSLLRTTRTCAALLDRWVGAIAVARAGIAPDRLSASEGQVSGAASSAGITTAPLWDPQGPIQDQWATLRAVVALAALTKTLTAVYEDNAGHPLDEGPALRAFADAVMDYADQIALKPDGVSWKSVRGVPRMALDPDLVGRLAETWRVFCAAPHPAPRRLRAFIEMMPE